MDRLTFTHRADGHPAIDEGLPGSRECLDGKPAIFGFSVTGRNLIAFERGDAHDDECILTFVCFAAYSGFIS